MQTIAPHAVGIAPPDISRWEASATGIRFAQEVASGQPGPEVLLTALVHGNEFSGAIALDAFLRSGVQPRRGRITALFCNVGAFATFDAARPDASRYADEDFNRVWSTDRLEGSGSSRELARAREIRPLVERATHLLDLHSMHEPAPPLFVTGLLPRNVAFAQALKTHSQVVMDEGHADGVRMRDFAGFGDAAGERIALLLEAGHHWDPASVATAKNTLMRFLAACGAIEAADIPAGWLLDDVAPPPAVEVTGRVVARSMDFRFTGDFRGGEVIARAGTVIAHDAGEPVVTPYDDCILVMPSVRQLRPGVTTVRLGRRAA
jgi:predicted deacylase